MFPSQDGQYTTGSNNKHIISAKLALVMEGTDFALKQIGTGITSFACVLTDELDPFREMLLAGNSLYAPDDDKDADDERASEDEDEEVDADSDHANDAFLTELVSLHTTPVPLVAPDVLTSGVLCWRFPAEISQGLYNARNGSNACGVIRMMLGYTHWKHKIPSLMECTNRLPATVTDVLCGCIELGNRAYDLYRETLPTRYLSIDEAANLLGDCFQVQVEGTFPVRLEDEHKPSTVAEQLRQALSPDSACVAHLVLNEKNCCFSRLGTKLFTWIHTAMTSVGPS